MVHIGFGGQLLSDNYQQYSNDDVRIESNKIVSPFFFFVFGFFVVVKC